MKLRKLRKNFWWTWHAIPGALYSHTYGFFDWGMGRIKHQHKDALNNSQAYIKVNAIKGFGMGCIEVNRVALDAARAALGGAT
jgi:hypothetical protein